MADARQFAVDAGRMAVDTHCRDVVVLDVRGISPITDYFVIATGSSGRQMRSVAEEVEEMGKPRGFVPFGRNGYEGESWLLADFVDVILHVLSPTARSFYDLEGLWGDAPRVDWQAGPRA